MRNLFFLAIFSSAFAFVFLSAEPITLQWLESKPKGIARDFYIWQFLGDKNITDTDALKAWNLVANKNPKITNALENALGKEALKRNTKTALPKEIACKKMSIEALKKSDLKCLQIGLNLAEVHALKKSDFDALLKIASADSEFATLLKTLREPNLLSAAIKTKNPRIFVKIFYGISPEMRQQKLNKYISAPNFAMLANQKEPTFNKLIQFIITSNSYEKLAQSFLDAPGVKVDAYTHILMGINELKRHTKKEAARKNALAHFRAAQVSPPENLTRNKAIFWEYLVTQDAAQKTALLEKLLKSASFDLFSIYAAQKLNKEQSVAKMEREISGLKNTPPNFDIKDPFAWQSLERKFNAEFARLEAERKAAIESKTLESAALESKIDSNASAKDSVTIKDSATKVSASTKDSTATNSTTKPPRQTPDLTLLRHTATAPHLALFLHRASGFSTHYYLMPFESDIEWESDHLKALTYAVAKQESHLLPALVSTSYALGMMQIMPFNVPYFAGLLGVKNAEYNDMFDPRIALVFGKFYLKKLESQFKHPLFAAYAYNGGPGFLKRTLENSALFKKNKPYEPWLSMELIPYEESRIYGQKVIGNFIIYNRILGHNVALENLLKKTLR